MVKRETSQIIECQSTLFIRQTPCKVPSMSFYVELLKVADIDLWYKVG